MCFLTLFLILFSSLQASHYAQDGAWIDRETCAIGRLDGTLVRYALDDGELVCSQVVRQEEPIEMVASLGNGYFLTSSGPEAIALWKEQREKTLSYDASYGVANAAVANGSWMTGHANGFVLFWEGEKVSRVVDVRSPHPVPSPHPLHNVRALAFWGDNVVISGSEDGDLCAIALDTGEVVWRKRYHALAERGINALAIDGDLLLVGNCATSSDPRNLWLFQLKEEGPHLLDARALRMDVRKNPFTFSVTLERGRFAASTGEGIVWKGEVRQDHIHPESHTTIAEEGGALLLPAPEGKALLIVGKGVRLDVAE